MYGSAPVAYARRRALFNPKETTGSIWESTFLDDASRVPASFDPTDAESVASFRDFFTKYGSHVIKSVTVGWRSRLCVSIARSSNITTENASADIKAEYDGVTGQLGTKMQFKDSNYEKSRQSQFLAIGGDQTLASLASSDPAGETQVSGQNTTNYLNWLLSTAANPAPIQFTLCGMWALGVFTPAQQAVLEGAYNYFALPMSAVPMYGYKYKDTDDYLYTTLENPEGSPTHINFGGYDYQGIPFYVLPQDTTWTVATKLYRYYNRHVHFFTTDPKADSAIISGGNYTEDTEYYSMVVPLGATGVETPAFATVYRWELDPNKSSGNSHVFGTDPHAPPPDDKQADGPKFLALWPCRPTPSAWLPGRSRWPWSTCRAPSGRPAPGRRTFTLPTRTPS